ncbi:MAG TPA: M56 family metallopeptidase [Terriglobales bacterium]|nr:M56 family metallopeptidase [Terriglobales bacterium]
MHTHFTVWSGSASLTYLLQVLGLYVLVRTLCWFSSSAHLRFRLWAAFLGVTVLLWLEPLFHLRVLATITALTDSVFPLHASSAMLPADTPMQQSWEIPPFSAPLLNSIAFWLTRVYFLVVAGLLLQTGARSVRLKRLIARARPASPDVEAVFQRMSAEAGVKSCALGILPGLRSPATAGWWRPRVLLPEELLPQIAVDELSDILRHELIHVRRRDYLWDRLASLSCQIMFFNPAVWIAYRRLCWERELLCDQGVVEARKERRLDYADCLAKLARWWFLGSQDAKAIDFASSASLIATRVRALLHEPVRYSRMRSAITAMCTLSVFACGLWMLPSIGISLGWPMGGESRPKNSTTRLRASSVAHRGKIRHIAHSSATAPSIGMAIKGSPSLNTSDLKWPSTHYLPAPPEDSLSASGERRVEDSEESATHAAADTTSEGTNRHGGWDESPSSLPRAATAPSWESVAIRAVITGIGLAQSGAGPGSGEGPETKDGK